MCGRIIQYRDIQELLRVFAVDEDRFDRPREREYNVPPSTRIPAIRTDGKARVLEAFHWGIPRPKGSGLVINARREGITGKPMFRGPVRSGRLVVPVDGFYEWRRDGSRRQPFLIRRTDDEPMALAGLHRRAALKDGTEAACLVIITTQPNAVVEPIHDRMPVILGRDAVDAWLADEELGRDDLARLLVPAPDEAVAAAPVGTRVNDASQEDPSLMDPIQTL